MTLSLKCQHEDQDQEKSNGNFKYSIESATKHAAAAD
jgi:hypothetical protein